ncbi:uridine kinase [Peribacillus sp. NPDC097225]|uniref:uridine kinase family protein n=1 Tax=Peribacillus sp. NPDC097225 TaxID=3364400 RepID=UPI00382FFAD4
MNFPTIRGQYTISQLIAEIQNSPGNRRPYLVAIDGRGGSGKSTLAAYIKAHCQDVTIVHMDDFYFPSSQRAQLPPVGNLIGVNYDWSRVFSQVLEPLTSGKEAVYQRYDWESDAMAEWHTIPVGGTVIIEGTYSTRYELAAFYNFTIWVECPREKRLDRGIERDGEEMRSMWEDNWMVYEDLYVDAHLPRDRVNLIVDGTR